MIVAYPETVVEQADPSPRPVPPDDLDFIALLKALRPHGGLLRWDADLQDPSPIAEGLTAGVLFAFAWGGHRWLPHFQLERCTGEPQVTAAAVTRELARIFDGRELAWWFVTPNLWLAGATPAACLRFRPQAVIEAARADRFVASG